MSKSLHAVWKGKGKTISVTLPYIIFEEGGFTVLYCFPLDLSGYGRNEDEAKESFKIVLDEYFKYTTNKNTLVDDLKTMGWQIKKNNLHKSPIFPGIDFYLSSNEDFNRIYHSYNFKEGHTKVSIPAFS